MVPQKFTIFTFGLIYNNLNVIHIEAKYAKKAHGSYEKTSRVLKL